MLTTEYLATIYVNDMLRARRADAQQHRRRRVARQHRIERRQHPAAHCL